jgi:hypothetical protein
MRCPGQDRRYWKEDAVFDVPCPKCGAAVEFFKDESSGRCRQCGHKLKNPKMALDCAQWCAYAEKCLGIVPEARASAAGKEGAVASRLIQAVKDEFEADPSRLGRALIAFQHAKELLAKEGGDPTVVLPAALLLEVGNDRKSSQHPSPATPLSASKAGGESFGTGPVSAETGQAGASDASQAEPPSRVGEIIRGIGLDDQTRRLICEIIHGYHTGCPAPTIESQIVCDSAILASLAMASRDEDRSKREEAARRDLRTESARARARSLFESG